MLSGLTNNLFTYQEQFVKKENLIIKETHLIFISIILILQQPDSFLTWAMLLILWENYTTQLRRKWIM